MGLRSFWNDRKWDGPLKVALEMELSRIGMPAKKGKTLEEYFADLHNYVTTFAMRKVSFLNEFEQKNNILFSDRYRRKYLATCFDAYCEDLQKVVFGFLEVIYPFIIFENYGRISQVALEELCSQKFEGVFDGWFVKSLGSYMDVILKDSVWTHEHEEKFRRIYNDICKSIKKKGLKEIKKFFATVRFEEFRDDASMFKEFVEKLRSEGFKC